MGENVSAARRAAAHVLSRCRRFDAWSAQTLESAIGKYRLSERDAALCTRLCRCVLQNAAWLDYYIALYCTQNLKRLQPQVLDALRLGAAQLLLLDRVPASAAVNESVSLVRESSPRAAGLVNAVLRRLAENAAALPPVEAEGAEYLSIRYSHPLWLCERLVEERGYDFAEGFCRANNEEAPLTVTVKLPMTPSDRPYRHRLPKPSLLSDRNTLGVTCTSRACICCMGVEGGRHRRVKRWLRTGGS